MKSIANNQLTFHNTKFNAVQDKGQIWLTSSELAKALEYSSSKSISTLFSRNANEFSPAMTQVIEMMTSGNYRKKVRLFSIRGAHLIAMFSTTPVAKEFRKWALDILDREVADSPIAKQFTDEELLQITNVWLWADRARKMSKLIYPALRSMESRWAGNFYDLSHETTYPLEESRKVLARETAHIKGSGRQGERHEKMLGIIRKELH
ncbi:P22AR C-terminal domain-containing protein [Yersinia rohdei]|uniref:P22AR C-terminal domain-containing protein n=1 Tax=Yersinia rohdei TaxID=29485 RepID=UPI0025AB411F|nr:P22AR C-terminal domain-containing protein [Yersinia rohdei]MDN0096551.1 P22AR C-terminal domain-containing protein [Yersinia rohdei]